MSKCILKKTKPLIALPTKPSRISLSLLLRRVHCQTNIGLWMPIHPMPTWHFFKPVNGGWSIRLTIMATNSTFWPIKTARRIFNWWRPPSVKRRKTTGKRWFRTVLMSICRASKFSKITLLWVSVRMVCSNYASSITRQKPNIIWTLANLRISRTSAWTPILKQQFYVLAINPWQHPTRRLTTIWIPKPRNWWSKPKF